MTSGFHDAANKWPSFTMNITVCACQDCPHFETIENGNPLVELKLSYWCNKLDVDLYNPKTIFSKCPYLDLA